MDARIIEVEIDLSGIKANENYFHTVGLSDAAVRESRDGMRAALKNCGYDIPPIHITINLAPADIRAGGSGFDLPMALGILGDLRRILRSTIFSASAKIVAFPTSLHSLNSFALSAHGSCACRCRTAQGDSAQSPRDG